MPPQKSYNIVQRTFALPVPQKKAVVSVVAHTGILLCVISEVSYRSVGCYQLSFPVSKIIAAFLPGTKHRNVLISLLRKVFLNGPVRPMRVADQDSKSL